MTERSLPAARRQVAVIDDDASVRHSLRFSLEQEGYTVLTYASAAEALANAEVMQSGCLVIDHGLPPTTGLDLLAGLRAKGLSAPAILMTGVATPAVRTRAAQFRVPVIEKPFHGHGLIEAIQQAFAVKPKPDVSPAGA